VHEEEQREQREKKREQRTWAMFARLICPDVGFAGDFLPTFNLHLQTWGSGENKKRKEKMRDIPMLVYPPRLPCHQCKSEALRLESCLLVASISSHAHVAFACRRGLWKEE